MKRSQYNFMGMIMAGIFGIVLLFMLYHYFIHGQILKNHRHQAVIDEESQLLYLSTKNDVELEAIGFDSDEIHAIRKMIQTEQFVTLNQFLNALIDEPGAMEKTEINFIDRFRDYDVPREKNEDPPLVNIHVEPYETFYLTDRETFATKLHYTAGFSESDFMLAFDARKRIDGEWFYLTGISGVIVMEARHDLSLYGEYHHQRFSGHKREGVSSEWRVDFFK